MEYKTTAMEHIKEGHYYNSRITTKVDPITGQITQVVEESSRFSEAYSSPSQIKKLVAEAVAKGKHTTPANNNYSVVYDTGKVIGTDLQGRTTTKIQVYLDDVGNVKMRIRFSVKK